MNYYSLLLFVTCILLDQRCVKGILNGSLAEVGEFPYVVAIIMEKKEFCGGVLISDRHVLTAAHCVTDVTRNYSIYKNFFARAGMNKLNDLRDGISIEVAKVSPHPNFTATLSPETAFNDIAVITLRKEITISDTVKPIALPQPDQEYPPETKFIFSGFGNTEYKGWISDRLRKMSTRAVGRDVCQASWTHHNITSGHLCTVSGACHGDSGGPLTIDGKVVVGIASQSFNDACGLEEPDIYTKVSHYIDFIKREVEPKNSPQRTKNLLNDLVLILRKNFENVFFKFAK